MTQRVAQTPNAARRARRGRRRSPCASRARTTRSSSSRRARKPMSPVLGSAAGADAEITPWAMSGAIWIDADRDGKVARR